MRTTDQGSGQSEGGIKRAMDAPAPKTPKPVLLLQPPNRPAACSRMMWVVGVVSAVALNAGHAWVGLTLTWSKPLTAAPVTQE